MLKPQSLKELYQAMACLSKHTTREKFSLNCPVFEKYIHSLFLHWSPDITHIQKQGVSVLVNTKIIMKKHYLSTLNVANANFIESFSAQRNVPLHCGHLYSAIVCDSRKRHSSFQGSGVEMTFRNLFETGSNEALPQPAVKIVLAKCD